MYESARLGEDEELSILDRFRYNVAGGFMRTGQDIAAGRRPPPKDDLASRVKLTEDIIGGAAAKTGEQAAGDVADALKCAAAPLHCWWKRSSTTTKVIVVGTVGFVGLGAVLFLLDPYVRLADRIF